MFKAIIWIWAFALIVITLWLIFGGGGTFLLLLYFLPTVSASLGGHRNSVAIFVLNLFLGWTFIGWIIALVWSFTNDRETASA